MDLLKEFKAVRKVSTPIVAVRTGNQPAAVKALADACGDAPAVRWDVVRGLTPLNDAGAPAIQKALGDALPESMGDPAAAMEVAIRMPDRAALFLVNAHRFIGDPHVSTGVGNLREPYKARGATCVLLGPAFDFPGELLQDVVILSDPLPDDAEMGRILDFVVGQAREGGKKKAFVEPTPQEREVAISALRGLSAFGAEQQAFLSLRVPNGGEQVRLDLDSLWARKIEAINAVPGLSMSFERARPSEVQGLAALMRMMERRFREDNPRRPGAILHIDEIDKALAGFGRQGGAGDSSGVTQDQVGQILQTMEDRGWNGVIPVGPPGTGKTMVSRTAAGTYGVPYLRLDLGALKGSLVGESEQRIRGALETIDRIAAGRVFVMATCNRLDAIPPELKRRFKAGIWYFDLPSPDERRQLWKLYAGKHSIPEKQVPRGEGDWSEGWTGAEIRNACEAAEELDIALSEARHLIVPICESGREDVARLRATAMGNFLDAAKGGKYQGAVEVDAAPARRRVEIES